LDGNDYDCCLTESLSRLVTTAGPRRSGGGYLSYLARLAPVPARHASQASLSCWRCGRGAKINEEDFLEVGLKVSSYPSYAPVAQWIPARHASQASLSCWRCGRGAKINYEVFLYLYITK